MTILSLLIIAAMVVAGLIAGHSLPADALVPVHWNVAGNADNFMPRDVALMIMPAVGLAVSALFAFLPKLEPRIGHLEASARLYATSWLGVLLFLAAIDGMMLARALGHSMPNLNFGVLGLALLIVLIGNFLGKSRSMFFIGIRTPWTLSSEEVWSRTHRLGGRLFVVLGLLALAAIPLGVAGALILRGLLVGLVLAALSLTAWSWLLWRRERDENSDKA